MGGVLSLAEIISCLHGGGVRSFSCACLVVLDRPGVFSSVDFLRSRVCGGVFMTRFSDGGVVVSIGCVGSMSNKKNSRRT